MRSKHAQPVIALVVGVLILAVGLTLPQFQTWQVDHSTLGAAASLGQPSALSAAPSAGENSRTLNQRPSASYGKLPLAFEANQGQTNNSVKFVSRGQGYTIFLTRSEAVLASRGQKRGAENLSRSLDLSASRRPLYDRLKPHGPRDSAGVLRLKLVGVALDAKVAGLDQLPGKSNYFVGNNPKKWRTNVPNYARVKYQNVYPGIDLVYYGNHGELEYDWVLAPGADLKAITFSVEAGSSLHKDDHSAKPLQINGNGDLIVKTDDGEVCFRKPVVYQPSTSPKPFVSSSGFSNPTSKVQNRTYLSGHYVLIADNQIGFEVTSYDKSLPLIVDPVLSYSTYVGGSALQFGSAIAVDASGNAYVTGTTESADFPTMNPIQAKCGGALCGNAFIAKLNAAGNALVYSTYLGGSGGDRAYGIAVDSSGNAYVMGGTDSTDFPTMNPFQAKNAGGSDAFVTKLNATGSGLVYSTYLGGSGNESQPGFIATALINQGGIAVDSSGSAYVAGYTDSTDFPTANPFHAANAGGFDGFVVKFNPAGNGLVYSTYLGGSSNDSIGGIAVDSAGNAYVAGSTSSTNFPTAAPFQGTNKGTSSTAFVTKFDAAGSALVYSTYLGGSCTDLGGPIAVDSSGNAYLTGRTCSTDFPTVNPFQAAYPSSSTSVAFVTKLNAAGSALAFSTYLGGNFDEGQGNGITVDSSGSAYVGGQTLSSGFPTLNPIQGAVDIGGCCVGFVTEFNATGNGLVNSTFVGGSNINTTWAAGIAVDASGNAYVTGGTTANDFPTLNAFQSTCVNAGVTCDTNVFVSKISPANAAAVSLGPTIVDFPDQLVNTTSAAQTVTLRNVGSAALTISNISITGANSGDFSLTSNTCGANLAGGGSCSLTVAFTPKLGAVETAAITVTDNATGSPQSATLTGKGVNPPVVTLSPTSLDFGQQLVGTTSANKTVTATNTGGSPLTSIAIGITGAPAAPVTTDFSGFETCSGSPLAVGASCTISVNFTPAAAGARADRVFINDNAPNSPQYIPLSGTGIEDFGIAVAPGSSSTATVAAGGTATFTLNVTPQQATANQTVALSCTGAPSLSTCTASPSSVTLNGTNAANVTVSLATTEPTIVLPRVPRVPPVLYGPAFVWLLVAVAFMVWSIRVKRVRQPAYLVLGLVLIALTFAACGGGGGTVTHNPGTPAGTYTLTVTGTSGNLSHQTTLTLTVN